MSSICCSQGNDFFKQSGLFIKEKALKGKEILISSCRKTQELAFKIFTPCKEMALQSCRRCFSMGKTAVIESHSFVKRHRKAFLLHALVALGMVLCRVKRSNIAMTVLPALGFNLMYTEDVPLPCDFLISPPKRKFKKISEDFAGKEESPNQDSPIFLESFGRREKILNRILERSSPLKEALPKEALQGNWSMLIGPSGCGKTAFLDLIAQKAQEKGHKVFFLSSSILRQGPLRGAVDARFCIIALELNRLAIMGKKPMLLIDEFAHLVQGNGPAFLSGLKNTGSFSLRFPVIGAMTTEEFDSLNDSGIKRRFIHESLKLLTENEIKDILVHRFSDSLKELGIEEAKQSIEKVLKWILAGKAVNSRSLSSCVNIFSNVVARAEEGGKASLDIQDFIDRELTLALPLEKD